MIATNGNRKNEIMEFTRGSRPITEQGKFATSGFSRRVFEHDYSIHKYVVQNRWMGTPYRGTGILLHRKLKTGYMV